MFSARQVLGSVVGLTAAVTGISAAAIPTAGATTTAEAVTIADIQGTGNASPFDGQTVTTSGIVTAAYPSGGFFGFYLQTPGTGGSLDLDSQDASDAVFVYQPRSAGAVTVKPGDAVAVTGAVSEHAGLTEVSVAAAGDIVTDGTGSIDPVVSQWPATGAQKESLEGMLLAPQGAFTVGNTYGVENYGELGLAQGDHPLLQPTEVARPGSEEAAAVEADNAARSIVLDDGSSTTLRPPTSRTIPYVSNTAPVVVGASVDFRGPVILSEGGSPSAPTYRFQPTQVATADPASWPAEFGDVRSDAPDERKIGRADVKIASFNVLNYFTTLGDADDDNVGDGGCKPYKDRAGDGNNVSGGCDQRGAWDPADLGRQQAKIVSAINALDADVVGLMEIENSARLGESTDEATTSLVAALNAAAGRKVWTATPSSAELPDASGSDVITNAIIYKRSAVRPLGEARALGDQSEDDQAFGNAREPIGQVFRSTSGGAPFFFVVNHFKSKGSPGPWPGDEDSGDGQGASNESRVRQATALVSWVSSIKSETGIADVALAGDFNSYTQEDPMQVLYEAGFGDSETLSGNHEYSYAFSGLVGSLDHVLLNRHAQRRFTGSDIWSINSGESVLFEYSRFNYTGVDLHADSPFRSSDHDPVVVGLARNGG